MTHLFFYKTYKVIKLITIFAFNNVLVDSLLIKKFLLSFWE